MGNQNVVITGGSKGIGKAIAYRLCEEAYNIVICSRHADEAKEVVEQLKQKNPDGSYGAFYCDVSDPASVHAFADACMAFFNGKIDVLINNAGVFLPGMISEEEDGNLQLMMETNLYSAYHLTRLLLPVMKTNRSGHIVNMCSIASLIAYPNGGSYSISKFALLGFSKVLREEMKPYGIKVTSVMPGATWSDSWKGVDLPEDRLMSADDVAKIVSCALSLSGAANLEDVVLRPQLGDL